MSPLDILDTVLIATGGVLGGAVAVGIALVAYEEFKEDKNIDLLVLRGLSAGVLIIGSLGLLVRAAWLTNAVGLLLAGIFVGLEILISKSSKKKIG